MFEKNVFFWVSLAIYIELEGSMMAKKDTWENTNNLAP